MYKCIKTDLYILCYSVFDFHRHIKRAVRVWNGSRNWHICYSVCRLRMYTRLSCYLNKLNSPDTPVFQKPWASEHIIIRKHAHWISILLFSDAQLILWKFPFWYTVYCFALLYCLVVLFLYLSSIHPSSCLFSLVQFTVTGGPEYFWETPPFSLPNYLFFEADFLKNPSSSN